MPVEGAGGGPFEDVLVWSEGGPAQQVSAWSPIGDTPKEWGRPQRRPLKQGTSEKK